MIKLMIVDDEAGILANLRKCINWDTWGITLVADACNAVDGYQKAVALQPDILICDINMPGKDGLSLCTELKAVLPRLKIMILSGYDEPQYLHRALSLGVSEYLLKPAGIDVIVPAVLKLKEQILSDRASDKRSQLRDSLLLDNITVLRLQFLSNLLHGDDVPNLSTDKAEMLGIPLGGPLYQTALLRILPEKNADAKSDAQLSMEFYQLTQNFAQIRKAIPQSFYSEIEEGDYFWLFSLSSPNQAETVIQKLNSLAHRHLGPSVEFLIGAGTCADSAGQISSSYANAVSALGRSTWQPEKQVFFYQPASHPDVQAQLDWLDREIINAVVSKQWSVCTERLNAAFELCRKARCPLTPLREICRHIMLLLQPDNASSASPVRDYHIDEL